MTSPENYLASHETAKERATLTIDQCVARAEAYIQQNGACLMLMDVIGSRQFMDDERRNQDFVAMIHQLNQQFDEYLPENNLTAIDRTEKGFHIIMGDAVTGGISDSRVIPAVAEFAETNYPHIPLRYGIAKDGYDNEGIALIK